jgi:hypothetical protein
MKELMSACGVLCSGCAAFRGDRKGLEHQKRTVAAWRRIYGMNETAEHLACAGCLAPDDAVFHSSVRCKARNCCRAKGLSSCAECPEEDCVLLEKAQSVWDVVPRIAGTLSPADREAYAKPYLGHRERLKAARASRPRRT